MKDRKSILAFILAVVIAIGCTACSTNEPDSSTEANESTDSIISSEPSTAVDDVQPSESPQTLGTVELNYTYTTKFGAANDIDYPSFTFAYPDGWTIISEEVSPETERIELTNDTGVIITFQYIVPAYAYGNMNITADVEISKIADSQFIPSYAQKTDYSDLGDFAVAKVKYASSDSDYCYYAVMPEAECGSRSKSGNFVTAFEYDGLLQFVAASPTTLASEEEHEVVSILNSFAAAEHERVPPEVDEIYAALQNGDFSYFAGEYMAAGIYHDYYGGGEQLPNLFLQENGVITGGLVYGSYPEVKPATVKRNEDGSYLCQVRYSSSLDQAYFVIYPEGVIGENPYIYNDPLLTETPYIHYFSIDGGVSDIIYYKVSEEAIEQAAQKTQAAATQATQSKPSENTTSPSSSTSESNTQLPLGIIDPNDPSLSGHGEGAVEGSGLTHEEAKNDKKIGY